MEEGDGSKALAVYGLQHQGVLKKFPRQPNGQRCLCHEPDSRQKRSVPHREKFSSGQQGGLHKAYGGRLGGM